MTNSSTIDIKTSIDPRSLAPQEFVEWASSVGVSEDSVRRWCGSVVGKGEYSSGTIMTLSHIPKRLAGFVDSLPSLNLSRHQKSTKDGFEKLLFHTHDNMPLETVLIPLKKEGAVSLCLSSQVGCVMGCAFCATAKMQQRRNLQSWEILDQFIQARKIVQAQGRRVTGAVFMGMGEPFLNFDNVIKTAKWLCYPVAHAISGKAITISTVGLVREINTFTDLQLPFRLSISLGAATDEKRARLVPVAARTPVAEVMKAARRYALHQHDRVNLSYVCISGENVGVEDAKNLAELIGDTPVRLDLIDVTDVSGRFQPPTPIELKTFRDALGLYLKQPVARRYSGGSDIRASCGSLAAS